MAAAVICSCLCNACIIYLTYLHFLSSQIIFLVSLLLIPSGWLYIVSIAVTPHIKHSVRMYFASIIIIEAKYMRTECLLLRTPTQLCKRYSNFLSSFDFIQLFNIHCDAASLASPSSLQLLCCADVRSDVICTQESDIQVVGRNVGS